jgi:hypothetical protein
MSTEASSARQAPTADSEQGLLFLILALVVLGVAGMFVISA